MPKRGRPPLLLRHSLWLIYVPKGEIRGIEELETFERRLAGCLSVQKSNVIAVVQALSYGFEEIESFAAELSDFIRSGDKTASFSKFKEDGRYFVGFATTVGNGLEALENIDVDETSFGGLTPKVLLKFARSCDPPEKVTEFERSANLGNLAAATFPPFEGREPVEARQLLLDCKSEIELLRESAKLKIKSFLAKLGKVNASGDEARELVEDVNSLLNSVGMDLELNGVSGRLAYRDQRGPSRLRGCEFYIVTHGLTGRGRCTIHDFAALDVTSTKMRKKYVRKKHVPNDVTPAKMRKKHVPNKS
jgi:hypothetical protein